MPKDRRRLARGADGGSGTRIATYLLGAPCYAAAGLLSSSDDYFDVYSFVGLEA